MCYNIVNFMTAVARRSCILDKEYTAGNCRNQKGDLHMKLTFIGAAHEVTGSCHLLEVNGKHILIDCGMEQGPDLYENQEIPVAVGEIDYVLLTHAHIDHSGLIPLLAKRGFQGQIVTTFATADLCQIMLRDSAHIQEFEAEWRNRKAKRSGAELYEPLYTMEDAVNVLQYFVPCDYNQKIELCEGVWVRFTDVGHLLGSASIEIWMCEDNVEKKIVFSGMSEISISRSSKIRRLCVKRIM